MKDLFPMQPGAGAPAGGDGGDDGNAGPEELRQAEGFAQALEELLLGAPTSSVAGGQEAEDLVGTARMVRDLSAPEASALDELTSARLKRDLLQRAAEQQTRQPSQRRRRAVWVAVLAAAAVLILGFGLLPDLLWRSAPEGDKIAATSVPDIGAGTVVSARNLRESLAGAAPRYPEPPTPRALFGEAETPSERAHSHVRYGLASVREDGFQRARRAYLSATGPRAGAAGAENHLERLAVTGSEPERAEVEEEER